MSSAPLRGITRSRVPLIALLALVAAGMFGCSGDDGKNGATGPTGPTGAQGPPGPVGGTAVPASAANEIFATVDSVTFAGEKPTITFSLKDELGRPLSGIRGGNVRFAIAKLTPASGTTPSFWHSYLANENKGDANCTVPGCLPNQPVASTEYATYETGNTTGGVFDFSSESTGTYSYTFKQDLSAYYPKLAFEPSKTHRVALQLRSDTSGNPGAVSDKIGVLASASLITNGPYDFVPAGGEVTDTRDIIMEQQCNSCHVELSAHGGGRTDYKYCVVCHNPSLVQAATGTTFDMMALAHRLHAPAATKDATVGGKPIYVWDSGDKVMESLFADVTYPQDMRNCTTCHNDTSANADNWKTTINANTCTTCHVTVDFTTGANHPAGAATDDTCAQCHNNTALPDLLVDNAHAKSIKGLNGSSVDPSAPATIEYAKRFQFNLISVDAASMAPGQFPKVRFQVVDPTNSNAGYDIQSSPSFAGLACGSGAATLTIKIGWATSDYTNTGSGSATGAQAGSPAQPISINPLNTKAVSTDAQCTVLNPAVTVVDATNKIYDVTSTVAVPATASGTAIIGMEGHPAGDLQGTGTYDDRIPVTNAFITATVTGTTATGARRQVVAIENCDSCHKSLSLHGNNRTQKWEECVICHNPDATDIGRRVPGGTSTPPASMIADGTCPAGYRSNVDNKCEETIDFKRMIHKIHAADIVVYGFGGSVNDFSEVTYPPGDKIGQCQACHKGTSYYPVDPTKVRATTTSTGADRRIPSDDVAMSPNAAVCTSCHTSDSAWEHMQQNGAREGAKQADGTVLNSFETCDVCHSAGRSADVKDVHQVGVYTFDDPK